MICEKCGRTLMEGEVCSCQSQNPPQGQYPQQGQPMPQGQYPQQGQPIPQGQYPQQGQHMPQGQYPQQGQPMQPGQYQYQQQAPQPNRPDFNRYYQNPNANNANYQGNPYGSNMAAPPGYHQQQAYISEEERLSRYMSNPRFMAARNLMASPLVLLYAIGITGILFYYFFVLHSYLHPFYILLSIGAWLTYITGVRSKNENTLPNVSGLGICAGVATAMAVILCISVGLILVLLIISVVGGIASRNSGDVILTLSISTIVIGLTFWLIFKFYTIQSRNIKAMKYCITNEAEPKPISIFPSVILIIGSIFQAIGLAAYKPIMEFVGKNYDKMITEYKDSIERLNLPDGVTDEIMEYLDSINFSGNITVQLIISGALIILIYLSSALLYIKAAHTLNSQISRY